MHFASPMGAPPDDARNREGFDARFEPVRPTPRRRSREKKATRHGRGGATRPGTQLLDDASGLRQRGG